MPDLAPVYDAIGWLLPLDCMAARFMRQALAGLALLAPMAAALGAHVVNNRMAFFADAVSHSAFAGVAIGLLLSIDPRVAMPAFGLLLGLAIMAAQRRGGLSSDTVIGVFFSAVVAMGLAVVSRARGGAARDVQRFLYGDILTIGDAEICALAILFALLMAFMAWAYNPMLYTGLSPVLAQAHGVAVGRHQYAFAALVSLVVVLSVNVVGVLLVTALMVVPAAAARNLARSAGGMFWWACAIGLASGVGGLLLSAQEWCGAATGACVVLVAFAFFLCSLAVPRARRGEA